MRQKKSKFVELSTEDKSPIYRWIHVADSLHRWSERLQQKFPPPFDSIAQWVDDAEFLIHTRTPAVIDPKNIDESLQNIENTIEALEVGYKLIN